MIGIEPEIVHCAEANGVCVRILGKGVAGPGQCVRHLIWSPWIVAESCIADSSVVRKTRMVRREVKSDVTNVDSLPQGHAEGLNRAIEVLVVKGVIVMPHARRWVRYFINNERATIDTGLRLDRYAG